MPATEKELYVFQPIEGVPVMQCGESYYCTDMTGTVWTRSESTSNDTTTVTVTCTFPQGAVYTQVGTLTTNGNTKTYQMTSQTFEVDS
jgi:hypothetical protein